MAHNPLAHFVVDSEKLTEFVVPDLSGFEVRKLARYN